MCDLGAEGCATRLIATMGIRAGKPSQAELNRSPDTFDDGGSDAKAGAAGLRA
jgi:hypothetical protein